MRQGIVPPRRGQQGFTLIEVMVAAFVLMIGVLGTFVMIDGANEQTRDNNARTAINALAREVLEQARTLEYTDVAETSLVGLLRQKDQIKGTIDDAGKWVITRRSIPVTISLSTCTFDDPLDGLGDASVKLPPGTKACAKASTATTTVDPNPDDFRRVAITASWTRGTKTNELTQVTQINNPGGGLGPRIVQFDDPYAMQVTDATPLTNNEIVWNARVAPYAAAVRWSIDDGVSSGDAASTNNVNWSWKWPIGAVSNVNDGTWVLDGVYASSAQPRDDRGIPGEMRVASVALNRRVPLAPTGVDGGRSKTVSSGSGSGDVIEVDWDPSPERDVLGYRVYRFDPAGGGTFTRTRVCPAAGAGANAVIGATDCTDTSQPGGATVNYEVVAVDRPTIGDASSGTRDGTPTPLPITNTLLGPHLNEPTITVAEVLNGRPHLKWTAPAGAGVGDVLFYRIYRDGKRLDATVDARTDWFDADFGTTTKHDYQVSAVNTEYREGKLSSVATTPAVSG